MRILRNDQPEDLVAVNDGVIQYVPSDVENIDVNQIVDKLGCVVLRYVKYSVYLLPTGSLLQCSYYKL